MSPFTWFNELTNAHQKNDNVHIVDGISIAIFVRNVYWAKKMHLELECFGKYGSNALYTDKKMAKSGKKKKSVEINCEKSQCDQRSRETEERLPRECDFRRFKAIAGK